jgi:hypothetical protein
VAGLRFKSHIIWSTAAASTLPAALFNDVRFFAYIHTGAPVNREASPFLVRPTQTEGVISRS